jgi:acetyl esterase/lipase
VRLGAALVLAVTGAACAATGEATRGRLESQRLVATLDAARLDAVAAQSAAGSLAGRAACDVALHAIVHATVAPGGERASASAALLVPRGAGCPAPHPIVAYSRGTEVVRARTMADPDHRETRLLAAMLAAHGYVVVATDYLGFGGSTLPYHPYLHADSQASVNVDAIRAARSALAAMGVADSGRLFVAGHSQGGHAALATHRAIERAQPAGVTVTASGPMAGPYDLVDTFLEGARRLPVGTAGSTVFLPFVLTSWQRVYGDLYATPADHFREPYASGIERLLPGAATFGQLQSTGRLPRLLGDLVTPKLVADLQDPASPLRRALAANTLLGWAPRAPTMLCGGSRDPVVPFANATRAAADFAARGGNVAVVDVERVPAFRALLPAPEQPASELGTYHGSLVPPLCLKTIRDELFAPLR